MAPFHGIHTVIEVDSILLPSQARGTLLRTADFNAGRKDSPYAYPSGNSGEKAKPL
jgi:hypothetical protein